MKKLSSLTLLLLCVWYSSQAQHLSHLISKMKFERCNAYTIFTAKEAVVPAYAEKIAKYGIFELDMAAYTNLLNDDAYQIKLNIELNGAPKTLLLIKTNLMDGNTVFSIQNSSGKENVSYDKALYYQGIIEGEPGSIAAISFFDNNIIGVISNHQGNFNIGKVAGSVSQFVMYNDVDLLIDLPDVCSGAPDGLPTYSSSAQSMSLTTNCVKQYVECDYELYLNNGSNINNTFNYVTGLYNIVSTVYFNDSMRLALSEIKLWTSADPYIPYATTLSLISAYRQSDIAAGFNGDLAHLLCGRAVGGGIGYLGVLCNTAGYKCAVSTGLGAFAQLPIYSWSVDVVSHELGHNLGSSHTHDCVWNGNNTRIDNCGGHAGYPSGTCADVVPDPPLGGTIMSYCHLVGAGKNLALGFGPQPAALMNANISGASCLSTCSTVGCEISVVDSIKETRISNGIRLKWKNDGYSKIIEYNSNLASAYTTYSITTAGTDSLDVIFTNCLITNGNIRISNYCNSIKGVSSVFNFIFLDRSTKVTTTTVNLCSSADTAILSIDTLISSITNTLQWYRNGVAIVNANTKTLKAGIAGIYKCRITNPFGCSYFTDSVTITSNVLNASYSQVQNNLYTVFTNATATSTPTAYFWDFGDGQSSSLQDPIHAYSIAGTYSVCLIATNNCGSDTFCNALNIVVINHGVVSIDTSKIVFNFLAGVAVSTITSSSLRVFSESEGLKSGNVIAIGNEVTFTPNSPFKAGDVLNITTTNAITTTSNSNYPSKVFVETVAIARQTAGLFDTFYTGRNIAIPYQGEVSSADVDKNGLEDILIIHHDNPGSATNLKIYLQTSLGAFSTATTYTHASSYSAGLETADFNSDGYPDIAYYTKSPSSIVVRLNTGTGSFSAAVDYGFLDTCTGLKVGDIDVDGNLDIVAHTSSSMNGNMTLILFNWSGNGSFFFQQAGLGPTGMDKPFLVDYDNDGDLDDIFTTNTSQGGTSNLHLVNNTMPMFWPGATSPAFLANKYLSAAADFDSDGLEDFLINDNNSGLSFYKGGGNIYAAPTASALIFNTHHAYLFGDVNGDSSKDIVSLQKYVSSSWVAESATTSRNTGLGSFSDTTIGNAINDKLVVRRMADFDNDGDIDFAYRSANNNLCIAYNNNCFGNVSILASSDTICTGGNTTLTAVGAISYTWQPGGFTTNAITVTPATTTVYTVTAVLAGGCSTSLTVKIVVNTSPSVIASSIPVNASVCFGSTVTLYGSGASSYNWSGGITNNVPFTPSATATYTLTGTSINGCTASATKLVTVNAAPTLTITSTPATATICAGESAKLNATGASTYAWSGGVVNNVFFSPTISAVYTVTGTGGNGCTASATKSVTVNTTSTSSISATICQGQIFQGYATSGTYTDTLVNAAGCDSIRVINLTVNALPALVVASSPSSSTVCAGTSIILSATGASTYAWSGGIINNVAFTPSTTSTYTVTATGSNGCTTTGTKLVTVNALPTLTITSTPATAAICAGESAKLNATGASTYAWSGGVVNNVFFTPTISAVYTVTGTGGNGCTASATKSVTVNATSTSSISATICQGQIFQGYVASGTYTDTLVNAAGCDSIRVINLTVNALPALIVTSSPSIGTVCAGTSMILSASGASTYAWSGGIANNVAFTPSATSTYTVTATGTNGCTITSTKLVTVNTIPTLTITATPANATICAGELAKLNATGASTYAWSGGVVNNVFFAPTISAVYTVTGTGGNGCTASATKSVSVNATSTSSISATICQGQTFQGYVASGTYTDTLVNAAGCDSIRVINLTVNALPALVVTSSPSSGIVCAGTSIILSASGASTHAWSGGIANNVAFAPSATSTYTVTATGSNGCTTIGTKLVTVNAVPSLTVTASPVNAVLCNGQSIILDATGANTYSWTGGISNNVSFLPNTTAIYTVTGIGVNGCSATSTQLVSVGATVVTNTSVTICQGQNYNGYNTSGTYYDTFTNFSGCDSVHILSLLVSSLPSVTINSVPANTNICLGQSVTLTGMGAATYAWSGNITNANAFTPVGNGTYTVTGTSAAGCTSTSTITVTTTSLPTVNVAVFPNDTICLGDAITVFASTSNASINWSGGILNNSSFVPTASSVYTVVVTSTSNSQCTASSLLNVYLLPNLPATISIAPSIFSGITGAPITYTASTNVQPPYTILWYLNNVYQVATTGTSWNTNIVAGNNSVYAAISTAVQCIQPDTAISSTLEVSNITSVANTSVVDIEVYPNPCYDILAFKGILQADKLAFYNAVGQKVEELSGSEVLQRGGEVNLAHLAKGVYSISFIRAGKVGHLKFIKQG
jgi:PKD repeat protein